MKLRVAVQMDPLESINIAGDSSFALMLAAQARGHEVWHYDFATLAYESDGTSHGKITAHAAPVTVQRVEGDHFTAGERRRIDLAQDIDVVLMRQDPPFHLGYITAAFLLDRLKGTTLVVNDPREVVNAPEKMFVLDYAQYMPPTLVARHIDDLRAFQRKHGSVVVKPLHGNGGKAIFRLDADGTNLSALSEVFDQTWPEPHMVQPFLPEVSEGDKRIVLVDGEFVGAINRFPGEGEFRSNLAQGGHAESTTLTAAEEEICAAMGPELKRRGLVFVGIDVIGGKWLTEINVTSPTGIVAIDRFNGTDTAALIWDAIERRHAAL
ncbi:glutathione synthase [Qipengyuania sp. XHP0207]|uniref:glutathione synthase n=1 Tax=Qipengyuania sp. XHP0207 TaxID=3038078 RepID=UPI002420455B|nr:glutathione synthase [Qipengyuania sp. XHP0207]MDG5749369.1 glutathione synthase [Qipengyuania sp. XHP0207]